MYSSYLTNRKKLGLIRQRYEKKHFVIYCVLDSDQPKDPKSVEIFC